MFSRNISFEMTCYEHKYAHVCLCKICVKTDFVLIDFKETVSYFYRET